jgi:hypothetical protein
MLNHRRSQRGRGAEDVDVAHPQKIRKIEAGGEDKDISGGSAGGRGGGEETAGDELKQLTRRCPSHAQAHGQYPNGTLIYDEMLEGEEAVKMVQDLLKGVEHAGELALMPLDKFMTQHQRPQLQEALRQSALTLQRVC